MTSQRLYYFDNNATTRIAPEVLEAMLPFLTEQWGNPSSAYSFGHDLGRFLDQARLQVAEMIHAEPRELLFTSCGTESNNSAIHSALLTRPERRHIVTTVVEHSATLKFCALLQKQGYEITLLPVDSNGALDLLQLERAVGPNTAIVSIMLANNETGVLFPVSQIADICHSKGVLVHTDAVQAPGKLPIDVKHLGADFVSLSAHKLHAPKGIGALYVKRHTKYHPYIVGGGQERGRRGGTENVANIVAFGRAAELATGNLKEEMTRVRALRDRLEREILERVTGTSRNGAAEPRLPNTSNLSFRGVEAEGILMLLDQASVCASSGSACTTGSLDPSHVLTAMGCSATHARASIRFSLGTYNTAAEIDYLLGCLPKIIERLRANAPVEELSFDQVNLGCLDQR
jgi:cysteine desulfurase